MAKTPWGVVRPSVLLQVRPAEQKNASGQTKSVAALRLQATLHLKANKALRVKTPACSVAKIREGLRWHPVAANSRDDCLRCFEFTGIEGVQEQDRICL